MMGRVGSNKLYHCLENLNNSILNDVVNRMYNTEMNSEEHKKKENEFLFWTSKLFAYNGISDPIKKIYITSNPIDTLPLIMFLMVNSIIMQLDYDTKLNTLVKKLKTDSFEPNYFIVGLLCFMNQ